MTGYLAFVAAILVTIALVAVFAREGGGSDFAGLQIPRIGTTTDLGTGGVNVSYSVSHRFDNAAIAPMVVSNRAMPSQVQ